MEREKTDVEKIRILRSCAYRFLAIHNRTKKEMMDFLLKKIRGNGWSEQLVDTILKQLEKEKYIDDKAYIANYVSLRSSYKQKGEYALRQELREKGVAVEEIDRYFESQPLDEGLLARKALFSKKRKIGVHNQLDWQRSASFLKRRGFSYEVIQKAIEEAGSTQ